MADETLAQTGHDVVVSYWKTAVSPPVYTEIGPIRNIADFGVELQEVESTTLDSDVVEYVDGLQNGSQFSMTLTTATTSAALIRGMITARTAIDLRIVSPAPLSETLYLTVKPMGWTQSSITPNGLMEITFKGRVTSDPTTVNPHA